MVGFIQRALAGPHYECEISMRIVQSDKEEMKQDILRGRSRPAKVAADLTAGIPPLRFGTVNDPIPSGADLAPVSESEATGWTTLNAPISFMYGGTVPYLADNLLQFPVANSDGNIVLSILPVVSTMTLLGVSSLVQRITAETDGVRQGMEGSEKGKHFDLPQMEYYKVEAVSDQCSGRQSMLILLSSVPPGSKAK